MQTSQNFLRMLRTAVTRSSSGGVAMYVTSGFVDDVMFAHSGRNRRRKKDVYLNWLTRGQHRRRSLMSTYRMQTLHG